jgi:hypothetical protein
VTYFPKQPSGHHQPQKTRVTFRKKLPDFRCAGTAAERAKRQGTHKKTRNEQKDKKPTERQEIHKRIRNAQKDKEPT